MKKVFKTWIGFFVGLLLSLGSGLAFAQETTEEVTPQMGVPPQNVVLDIDPEEAFRPSVRDTGVSFNWALLKFNRFRPTSTANYSQVYGTAGPLITLSGDYFLLQSKFGHITAGGTSGVFFDSGNISGSTVSLMAIPFMTEFAYRAEIVKRQLWIPFVKVGVGGWYFRQKSAESKYSRSGVNPMMSAGVGTDLLLDFFLWDYSKFMDEHFGINWTTITGEVRYVANPGGGGSDLSHWRLNIGVRFEL